MHTASVQEIDPTRNQPELVIPDEATSTKLGETAMSGTNPNLHIVEPLSDTQQTWLRKVLTVEGFERFATLSTGDRQMFADRLATSYSEAHVKGQNDQVKQQRTDQMFRLLSGASTQEIAEEHGLAPKSLYTALVINFPNILTRVFDQDDITSLLPNPANPELSKERISSKLTTPNGRSDKAPSKLGAKRRTVSAKSKDTLSDHIIVGLDRPFVDYNRAKHELPELFADEPTGLWKYSENSHRLLINGLVDGFKDDTSAQARINEQFPSQLKRDGHLPQLTGESFDDLIAQSEMYRIPKPWEAHILFKKLKRGLVAYDQLYYRNRDPSKERMLYDVCREGAYAYQAIYTTNIRLAAKAASAKATFVKTLGKDDLMMAGLIGMRTAIEKFDEDLGFTFSTYAMNWIKQEIQRTVHNTGRLVRIPVHVNERYEHIKTAQSKLLLEWEKEPTNEELAAYTGFDLEEIERFKQFGSYHLASLDQPTSDDWDADTLGDLIPSKEFVEARLDTIVDRQKINEFILQADLTFDEMLVVSVHFGFQMDDLKGFVFMGRTYEDIFDTMSCRDDPGSIRGLALEVGVKKRSLEAVKESALRKLQSVATA